MRRPSSPAPRRRSRLAPRLALPLALLSAGGIAIGCSAEPSAVRAPAARPAGASGPAAAPPAVPPAPVTAAPTSSAPGAAPVGGAGPAARTFTVTASGDLLIHRDVSRRAARLARAGASAGAVRAVGGTGTTRAARRVGGYDFRPLLAGTTHLVRSADLALCHVEVPLSPPGGAVSGYPRFAAPAQLADAVAEQGYDSCSTASNHSLDQGTAGVTSTLTALDAAGVRHAGTARSAAEAATPTILTVKGVKVAHLATTYGFNGLLRPRDKPWLASAIDDDDLLAKAARARGAGAQVVVVSVHWGTEKQHEPDAQQRALAPKLLASPDVDLVIGHHAHVVQPLERIGGKWVAYGLGNLVAGAAHDYAGGATHEGILPRFTFREQPDGRFRVSAVEVFPTYVDKRSLRVLDASGAGGAVDGRRARAARARTASVVLSRGAGAAGAVVR